MTKSTAEINSLRGVIWRHTTTAKSAWCAGSTRLQELDDMQDQS